MSEISYFFSKQGPLAEVISGFTPRQAQTDMAEAVVDAITTKSALVVEAGTGTGKTFAYLAPALLSKRRFIVSTGTKNLQEQLFHRDLPLVKKAIDKSKKTALLKGRANYACLHRIAQHGGGNQLFEKEVLHDFSLVKKWVTTTNSGDIGELTSIKEDSQVIPVVTSTVDNCLGKDCTHYDDCFLVLARKKAMEADVIVVNHHLFFADLALKDTGFGELIPEVDLLRDMIAIQKSVLKDAAQLSLVAEKTQRIIADLRLLFPYDPKRGNWAQKLEDPKVAEAMTSIRESVEQVQEVAKVHEGRDKDLDLMIERLSEILSAMDAVSDVTRENVSLWYETTPKHIILHLTPLSIADKFSAIMDQQDSAWVFTSATLMVESDFSHYQSQMGLNNASTLLLDSPFDYQQQAMLCVPRFLPEPNDRSIRSHLLSICLQLIDASKGRAFMLFTSHAMMRDIANQVKEEIDTQVLIQGDTTKQALLDTFLSDQSAVLFATGAFWEGVDVKGDDLLCVLIDKLPFSSPDDPLLQARIEDCRKKGGNAFSEIQIPQAVITLKQGAGRLIRDGNDRGVLVICDNRLVTKQYGQSFIGSLPNMKRTRSIQQACDFLSSID